MLLIILVDKMTHLLYIALKYYISIAALSFTVLSNDKAVKWRHLHYTLQFTSVHALFMHVTRHYSTDLLHINFSNSVLHREQSTQGLQDVVARATMLQGLNITPGLAPGLGSHTLGTRPAPAIRVSQEVLWCRPLNWYLCTNKRMAVDRSLKVSLLWNFTQSLYLMAFSEWRKWDCHLFDRRLAHSWV